MSRLPLEFKGRLLGNGDSEQSPLQKSISATIRGRRYSPDFCAKAASNERIAAEEKIYNCERGAELALAKYEKALIRYGWDIAQARIDARD